MRPLAYARGPVLALALTACAAGGEGNWPQWRGPNLDGSAAAAAPVSWSTTENIVWKRDLPSWSAATPIVWGDTIFVTSAEAGFSDTGSGGLMRHALRQLWSKLNFHDDILLLAINAADGSVRWTRTLSEGNAIHLKHNEASPSPVTDGRLVWTITGTGVVTCFDFEGERIWRRDLSEDYGEFGLNWGYGSSPALDQGRLYIEVLHGYRTEKPSYVLALDAASGKTLWRVERPTDAESESRDAYTTPVFVGEGERRRLAVSGAGYLTLHDLDTGKETARIGGLNPAGSRAYRNVASPTAAGDVIFTPSRRKPFLAFRLDEDGKLRKLWSIERGPDVPTPTTDAERVWIVDDKGIIRCLRAADGSTLWGPKRLAPGTYTSSLVLADGKVYATSEEGTTSVIEAADEFKVLSVNKLGDYTLASPALAGGRIYLRTARFLWAIE